MQNPEIYIFIFLILGSALASLYAPRIKGAIGEQKVSFWLRLLPKKDYEVIHDLLLQTDSFSSQIDHVVVSVYGIFVIETKNYKGWIHGHENSPYLLKNVYSDVPVIYTRQILKTIRRLRGERILSPNEVAAIMQQLKVSNTQGRKARKRHVRTARKNSRRQRIQEKLSICPRCGGNLILRDGKYGKFYSCANFPKCKYTKK